jgi:cytohesin
MRSLFDPDELHLVRWLNIWDIDPRSYKFSSDIPNPLYYASLCGFHDLVEHLVRNHPRLVNATGGAFRSPLLTALSRKHIRVAEFLLLHGAKVDLRGTDGQTPLHFVADQSWWVDHNFGGVESDAISFLLKHGADVDSRNGDHCTPLHLAALWDSLEVAQILLEHGADIDSRNDEGQTPLHMTCEGDGADVAQLLLERGADVNAPDNNLNTPLLVAVRMGHDDVALILLGHGAEPNVKNEDGKTSLHYLEDLKIHLPRQTVRHLESPNLELAHLVLQHGADVNAQDKYHTTPLHVAMKQGFNKVAQIFLEHGAVPNLRNKHNEQTWSNPAAPCVSTQISQRRRRRNSHC